VVRASGICDPIFSFCLRETRPGTASQFFAGSWDLHLSSPGQYSQAWQAFLFFIFFFVFFDKGRFYSLRSLYRGKEIFEVLSTST
jgi:hypothetical protein